jgi:hypothetical protein
VNSFGLPRLTGPELKRFPTLETAERPQLVLNQEVAALEISSS